MKRWPMIAAPALAGILMAGALWFWGIESPPVSVSALASARPSVTASATAPEPWATAGDLPSAWQAKTTTAVPTRTSTPTPTATAPGETPLPTDTPVPPTPTVELSPTPTRTPLHRPTDRDPTRLTIPAIGLDTPVVTVGIETVPDGNGGTMTQWQVADYAAGFHEGTARIGHVGNTVLAGHNNIRGDVFKDLYKLEEGDEVFMWLDDWSFRYKVSAIYRLPVRGAPESVQADNIKWILPTNDERLTLLTCWPPYSNSHRLIVVAYPVPWEN